ncbi:MULTISPECIES: bifunctional helix-turn-helix transcriptional regulator/GNAT family N-acetyltransferase [unclassified Mesorhizobium]|uniref:bifunctional helix-turn-helix transcriptional regulator/GNAT family N-acetyltransferase n=2 Tax=Mesorhizobium TaxID=68287 RepID=UPI0007FCCA55|nr:MULTISPECIES: bifunctional helix-turn-helix transcriptional regulator/GNAT family N-acetyltransferase [unclassified Mesorhizobium]MDG4855349.1 bifunctional helix-turn-helix transcriptional regulator/GNAT family N-acetyltransferase [Mesorhizobium sp. WSM4982]MDG4913920.1 bifunctional helix-turn-helix transcriptional regulator/GNAT family N-acetyltransferase [Mesorhizobium sp. WSM4983]OBQ94388.1 MarR family transcriptional regulator [Mesorhizobium sp. AA23]
MTIHDHPGNKRIDAVRAFNRFYTRQIGLLDEGLLKSPFSLTEARVLYELAHRDGLVASDLVRDLDLDPGYVSRLLKKFEERGLVERAATEADARRSSIALTPAGREAFAPLNQDSHDQVRALLDRLAPTDQERLVKAMRTVQDLLGDKPQPKVPYILRPLQVGDIGWITHRQGLIYAQDYGWDETYEALVAEILGEFVKNFVPQWESSWIAEREGEVVGSVFVMRKSPKVAKLRLLYVEPSARGLGIGRRLVDECIAFSRAKGYKTLTLWTNDILGSARRIYQAAGFKLAEEERHHSFGKDLVGQTWNLEL